MRVARLACALLALSAVILQASADASDAPLRVEQVAPGVFVHYGQPLPLDAPGHDDIANTGFIIGDRCVAVIDTGGSVRMGRALRAAVTRATSRPICFVINTHVHVDHVLGNAAFRDTGARFVGHARLPAEIIRNRGFFVAQYGADLDAPPAGDQIVAPDLTVQDTLELDLGRRVLELRAWPPAHTSCDLTVLDVASGTLWTGDLLFRRRLPALDGDLAGWLEVIDRLARLHVQRAIPGHGPLAAGLSDALQPERRYLRALLDDVRRASDAGESLQQTIDTAAQGERSDWLLWDSTHPRNVTRVYEQLEWQ